MSVTPPTSQRLTRGNQLMSMQSAKPPARQVEPLQWNRLQEVWLTRSLLIWPWMTQRWWRPELLLGRWILKTLLPPPLWWVSRFKCTICSERLWEADSSNDVGRAPESASVPRRTWCGWTGLQNNQSCWSDAGVAATFLKDFGSLQRFFAKMQSGQEGALKESMQMAAEYLANKPRRLRRQKENQNKLLKKAGQELRKKKAVYSAFHRFALEMCWSFVGYFRSVVCSTSQRGTVIVLLLVLSRFSTCIMFFHFFDVCVILCGRACFQKGPEFVEIQMHDRWI